jgi:TRAP-type C4-dicarboxylate transport system substrate-binding protein
MPSLLAALLLGLLLAGPAAAAEWRLQGFAVAGSPVHAQLQAWAGRIAAASRGRLTIEVLPAGAVVPSDQTVAAINADLIQGHYNAPSFFAATDPAFAVLGDTMAAYDHPAQRDGWFGEGGGLALARRLYERHGLHLVGPLFWPAEWLAAAAPMAGPDELAGRLVRAPEGLVGDLLRQAGAEVVSLPGSEVTDALQTGAIDATDWSTMAVNQASGLYQVAPYNLLIRHSMAVTEISIGQAAWAALPIDLQVLVEAELGTLDRTLRQDLSAEETALVQQLATQGVESRIWDAAAARTMRAAVLEVWRAWRQRSAMAAEIIDSHEAYMRKLGLL